MLCYAMSSYAIMICYATLWYAMLFYDMLCYYAMILCYDMLCYAIMLWYAMLLYYVILRYAIMLWYAMLCHLMLLYYAMICYAIMLYYARWRSISTPSQTPCPRKDGLWTHCNIQLAYIYVWHCVMSVSEWVLDSECVLDSEWVLDNCLIVHLSPILRSYSYHILFYIYSLLNIALLSIWVTL